MAGYSVPILRDMTIKTPENLPEICELEQAFNLSRSRHPSARLSAPIGDKACGGIIEPGIRDTPILTCDKAASGKCPYAETTTRGDHTPPTGTTRLQLVR